VSPTAGIRIGEGDFGQVSIGGLFQRSSPRIF
jgi:hypothetical protein